jgi:hypothetical protein
MNLKLFFLDFLVYRIWQVYLPQTFTKYSYWYIHYEFLKITTVKADTTTPIRLKRI